MKVSSVLLAIILLGTSVYAAQVQQQGRNVETIEIRGNRRVVSDTIRFHIRTRQGAPLNMETIRRDVKELYAQNYFEDIRVDTEEGRSGGVIVIFTVKEKPLIRSIDFTGADSITVAGVGLASPLTVNGGAGNDIIDASRLRAGEVSNLTINGGDGDDQIVGSAGNDTVIGGRGSDTALLGATPAGMV